MLRTGLLLAILLSPGLAADEAVPAANRGRTPVLFDRIAIPGAMSFQGKLTDSLGVPVEDTTWPVTFRLYTQASGGTHYWQETQDVRTSGGLFSTLLGSVTPIPFVPDAGTLYLGMRIGADPEMAPRVRVAAAAYSFLAGRSDSAGYAAAAPPVGSAGGDLSGTYPGPTVDGLRGRAVAASAPGSGQVLKWTGSQWAPRDDSTGGSSGTVTSVSQGAGITCSPNPITATGTVSFNSSWGDGRYVNESQAAGGDLSGTYPNPTVDGLRGRAVGSSAPGTGQVLKWTGSQWAPRDDSTGGGDNAWTRGSPDSVLFTVNRLGIARGNNDNALLGTQRHTHVNLGSIACTTGMSGQNYVNCTVAGGGWNVAAGNGAFVGAGTANRLFGTNAVLVGGERNEVSNNHAALLGGSDNTASGYWSVVAGGNSNRASDFHTTVSGGVLNVAGARFAAVGGGDMDSAMAFASGVFSGYRNTAGDQASDSFAMVGGGRYNRATGKAGFVGGGEYNTASGPQATVAGGAGGAAGGVSSGVLSGYGNTGGDAVADTAAVVVGGRDNTAADRYCFVGGGRENLSFGYRAVVVGGSYNSSYNLGAVSGGSQNQAATQGAVPGGYQDTVLGMNGFAAGWHSKVNSSHTNSAAFTGSHTTASNQVRAQAFSTGTAMFSIDHPGDPANLILNQYAVGSPELVLMYRGIATIGPGGRAEVLLPAYFAELNRNPMVQLTGVGTNEVFVSEEVEGNRFVIGGRPGTRVYWTVTGERRDQTAEIARLLTPVEQRKTGELVGHSLDDDCLASSQEELARLGAAGAMRFRTGAGEDQARAGGQADAR